MLQKCNDAAKPLSDVHLQNPLTPYHLPDTLKLHDVDGDCELRGFVDDISEFKRGHTYYELTNKVENIHQGKEVLLHEKKTKKWFQLVQTEAFASSIPRNIFGGQYRVFIQSFGSGARHLPRGTSILQNHAVNQVVQ